LFISQNFPVPKGLGLEAMRQRSEDVHAKINEKFLGTFKGTEEERKLKVDETTGKIQFLNKMNKDETIQKYQLQFIHQLMLI
jgi:hypothetical protein